MNNRLSKIAGTSLGITMLAAWGCGKHKDAVPKIANDTKAFDAAGAALKAEWSEVLAAAETNGYATVILTCKKMQREPDLTDEQRKAAVDTQSAMMARMNDAAQKGDANAMAAIQEV